jgi:hypothetical protein
MQKWLMVVVFTMMALVAAMGVRNMTVNATAASTQPVLVAWGGGPAPTCGLPGNPPCTGSQILANVAWGGGPAPTWNGSKGLN